MSNWPIGIPVLPETLGEQTGEGTTITPGNGSKSSYVTLGTTGRNYGCFALHIISATNMLARLDLAIGASDEIIIPDLALHSANSGGNANAEFTMFPLAIPEGVDVKIRAQSNAAGHSVRAMLTGYAYGFTGMPSLSRLIPLNTWSGNDPTNTANFPASAGVNTAWQELIASTPETLCGYYLVPLPGSDVARTAGRFIFEIGTGTAGSEVVRHVFQGGNTSAAVPGPIYGPIPDLIPAGTRLAWRARHFGAAPDAISVAAYGLVL